FISFEGMEGSGKSSAMATLAQMLEEKGLSVLRTREPGGSRLGRELRALLLDSRNSDICPETELFLYLADRAQHVHSVIRPALDSGTIVFSDRYADSTIVYQGYGRGLPPDELYEMNNKAVGGVWPDYTLLFDVDPALGLQRARGRNKLEGKEESEGRFEAESLAFHTRVRQGFLDWAARFPARFRIIDAGQTQDDVIRQARTALNTLFTL
ncbi:dTMP kinase, partial [Desulfovibrio sp. OttesenSCG-928-I05]|nr:dTMP kinase [Desulfovibrio sp. OttesenSCG-928-I05]